MRGRCGTVSSESAQSARAWDRVTLDDLSQIVKGDRRDREEKTRLPRSIRKRKAAASGKKKPRSGQGLNAALHFEKGGKEGRLAVEKGLPQVKKLATAPFLGAKGFLSLFFRKYALSSDDL